MILKWRKELVKKAELPKKLSEIKKAQANNDNLEPANKRIAELNYTVLL